ncbi:MAG: hypothetical protein ABS948_15525 [Solibacillus sp.]
MIFVLKNESMYLLDKKKIVVFQELLKANRHLSTYLADFKYGYSFQLQVAFDLYTFLTTEPSELYTNLFFNFERHYMPTFMNYLAGNMHSKNSNSSTVKMSY